MIVPTNGRVVLYTPGEFDAIAQHDKSRPLTALVVHVWGPRMVNLTVFDSNGSPHGRTSVPLLQDDDKPQGGSHCQWMEYQKGQAAKTEQLEAAARQQ